jgi:hypothetical protein
MGEGFAAERRFWHGYSWNCGVEGQRDCPRGGLIKIKSFAPGMEYGFSCWFPLNGDEK